MAKTNKLKDLLTKKISFNKDDQENEYVEREFTIDDVTPEIYEKLKNEWYKSFDFMKLYQPSLEQGFERFIPHATLIVAIIILIINFVK